MAATGKNQPSHVPPLKNKPETTHPCVDHGSKPIHRTPSTRGRAGFGCVERTDQEARSAADPARLPLLRRKTGRLEEERRRQDSGVAVERFKTGIQTVWDWVSNSIGSACAHTRTSTHTHTLEGKQLRGTQKVPETVTEQRGLEGVGVSVCVVADFNRMSECVCG